MKKLALILIGVLASVPVIASAQTVVTIVGTIGSLIVTITPVIVALALLYFFWGLAKYILAAGDEAAQGEGKRIMIWGIIALFVIVSVWGLVQVLNDTFGINQQDLDAGDIPSVNIST
ncbi:hypothetical protein IID27_02165 [Patescibacteria group bacterium]|nr:hypothetical protein [Patescibacteria group bacterium]